MRLFRRRPQFALQVDVEAILSASAEAKIAAQKALSIAETALEKAENPQAQLDRDKEVARAEANARRGAAGHVR